MLPATGRLTAEFNAGFLDADEFSDTIGNLDVPWRVGVTARKFNAHVRRRTFTDCTFGEMRFGACTGVRDRSEISRKDSDYICLSHLKQGHLTFVQGDKNILVERGDMLLWDGATPSMFINSGASRFELIWLPMAMVERRVGPIRDALGQSASCADGAGLLLSQHLHNLHQMIGDMPPPTQQRVIEATVDLIFACFSLGANQSGDMSRCQGELLEAAKSEISRRMGLGRVSPAGVADTLGISVRYLQKIFARSGQTFSGHVAQERLEYARRLLADRNSGSLTLTEIAHLAGYCDLSHLNRVFRHHYGTSPSAYRFDQ